MITLTAIIITLVILGIIILFLAIKGICTLFSIIVEFFEERKYNHED